MRVRTAANNSQLRTTAFEIFLHVFLSIASKVSQFFSLRTTRVVTRVLDSSVIPSSNTLLPTY